MPTQWRRTVSLGPDGQTLVVGTPNGGNPSGRTDPPDSITLRPADLPATITYTGQGGVRVQDVAWDGDHTGVTAPPANGNVLTVTDSGGVTDCSYYVRDTEGRQTGDPQIHNVSS